MVLVGFGGGFAVELHGLMGAEVDAGEALCAVAAAAGLAVSKGDVALWAHLGTEAAAYTLVGVDRQGEHGQRAALHSGEGAQGSRRAPPGIVAAADTSGDVGGDTLQAAGIAVELPHLVVGVAAEAHGAVVGHTNLVAVSHIDAFGSQHPPHRPDGIARLRPTGDDDEYVCLLGEPEARHQLGHRARRIEPIAGEDEADALLMRQVLGHRPVERHHLLAKSLRQLAADGQAVACA